MPALNNHLHQTLLPIFTLLVASFLDWSVFVVRYTFSLIACFKCSDIVTAELRDTQRRRGSEIEIEILKWVCIRNIHIWKSDFRCSIQSLSLTDFHSPFKLFQNMDYNQLHKYSTNIISRLFIVEILVN